MHHMGGRTYDDSRCICPSLAIISIASESDIFRASSSPNRASNSCRAVKFRCTIASMAPISVCTSAVINGFDDFDAHSNKLFGSMLRASSFSLQHVKYKISH
jgi:hypothetical protein